MNADDLNDLYSEPLDVVIPLDDTQEMQEHFGIFTSGESS
jgi:hypothetical protein